MKEGYKAAGCQQCELRLTTKRWIVREKVGLTNKINGELVQSTELRSTEFRVQSIEHGA